MRTPLLRFALTGICLAATLTIAASCADPAFAECLLYKGQYDGGAVAAHIDGGIIYRGQYGYDAVGRIEGGAVYQGRYGSAVLAYINKGLIYRDQNQYEYNAIGHVNGRLIYKGIYEGSYAPVANALSCSAVETAAVGAVLLLGLL